LACHLFYSPGDHVLPAWFLVPALDSCLCVWTRVWVKEMFADKNERLNNYSASCLYHGQLFMGTWQSIPMDKQQQPPHAKHDRPICEKCQAANIKIRPDGSYSCNHCGYDSTKQRKK
jgi:hypothetical protein